MVLLDRRRLFQLLPVAFGVFILLLWTMGSPRIPPLQESMISMPQVYMTAMENVSTVKNSITSITPVYHNTQENSPIPKQTETGAGKRQKESYLTTLPVQVTPPKGITHDSRRFQGQQLMQDCLSFLKKVLKDLYPEQKDSKLTKFWIEDAPFLTYLTNSSKLYKNPNIKKHVHFLKTFKTGGTTISSILMKIALKYGAIVVPKGEITRRKVHEKDFIGGVSEKMLAEEIGAEKVSFYRKYRSFFINHSGLEDNEHRARPLAEKLFHENETFFALIVRNPVSRFKSKKQFLGVSKGKIARTIKQLASHCPYLESAGCGDFTDVVPCPKNDDPTCFNGRYSVFNETRALNYIQKFDLVMITEQMSESIVLMSNALGYPVDELGTVKLKSCEKKAYNYSTEELRILGKAYKSEMMFYNLTVKEFTRRKNELGQNFLRDQIGKLKEANSYTEKICEYRYIAPNESTIKDQSMFSINVEEILKDPRRMVECLPILFDAKNGILNYIINSLQLAHRQGVDMMKSGKPSAQTNTCYPYSLPSFFEIFNKMAKEKLLQQHQFF